MTLPKNCNACDVSVVIPTHGRPTLLKRAIASVLKQVGPRLEVIVVLDGEDGMTQSVLEEFSDPRVRLLTLTHSVGGSAARNAGGATATGRYIALLDDDDEWLPNKLAKQLVMADASSDKNFVVVTQYLYRLEGRVDEVWPGHLPSKSEPLSEFLFGSRGGFQTSTYLCPRELYLHTPFVVGLKKHQDWDWFLSLADSSNFEVLIVPEPLSIYWVPSHGRTSISGTQDWRFSQAWAKRRLSAMTPKAYAMFLVKICARSAAAQNAGSSDIWFLLKELIFVAQPTVGIVIEFFAAFVIPPSLRLRLRYGLLWFQRNASIDKFRPRPGERSSR